MLGSWSLARWMAAALGVAAVLSAQSIGAFRTARAGEAANVAVITTDSALLAVAPCPDSCAANLTGIASLSGTQ